MASMAVGETDVARAVRGLLDSLPDDGVADPETPAFRHLGSILEYFVDGLLREQRELRWHGYLDGLIPERIEPRPPGGLDVIGMMWWGREVRGSRSLQWLAPFRAFLAIDADEELRYRIEFGTRSPDDPGELAEVSFEYGPGRMQRAIAKQGWWFVHERT